MVAQCPRDLFPPGIHPLTAEDCWTGNPVRDFGRQFFGGANAVFSQPDPVRTEQGSRTLFPARLQQCADWDAGIDVGISFQVEGPNTDYRFLGHQSQSLGYADPHSKGAEPARSQRHGNAVQLTSGQTTVLQDVHHRRHELGSMIIGGVPGVRRQNAVLICEGHACVTG